MYPKLVYLFCGIIWRIIFFWCCMCRRVRLNCCLCVVVLYTAGWNLMDIFSFVVLFNTYLFFCLYIMIKHMYCKIFGYSLVHTFKCAHSDVTVDNWAYVDVTFFTEHASYNNTLKFGTPYAEQPLCVCVEREREREWELNLDIVPLVVHCNLWKYIDVVSKSKYCLIGNFCTETFVGARSGWCYI
jgi:hypothetical protein